MTPRLGAIVPHAPVLVPGVGEPVAEASRLTAAAGALDLSGLDAVVVISPHGAATGVYTAAAGSLAPAGPSGYDVSADLDEAAAAELAGTWGRPLLPGPADHGVVVPLLLVGPAVPVVAVALQQCTGPGARPPAEAAADGRDLARALAALSEQGRIGVLASAHTSASITARAPLTERPAARRLEQDVLQSLARPRTLAEIPPDVWEAAGSCGVGPLTALGLLLGDRPLRTAAYGFPFGVGYLVACTA